MTGTEWWKRNTERGKQYNRQYYADHKKECYTRHKAWELRNRDKMLRYKIIFNIKSYFGSVLRYQEALQMYEGDCAFACGNKAEMVHHRDGNSIRNSREGPVINILNNLLPLCKACHAWLHKPAKRRY